MIFSRQEAELLTLYLSMTPVEPDQLFRLAVALAPPKTARDTAT
jgi:hypothetical protein